MHDLAYPWYDVPRFATLPEMLKTQAATLAGAFAFEFRAGDHFVQKTYGEVWDETACLAAALDERGLSGSHVAILGANSYEWILAFFAVVCGGSVAIPINHMLAGDSLLGQIAHSDARALIYGGGFSALAGKAGVGQLLAMPDLPGLIGEGRRLLRNGKGGVPGCGVGPGDLALIMYTSGTTGQASKGVMLSHEKLLQNAYATGRSVRFGPRAMMPLPLFHSFAILPGTIVPMLQGCHSLINRGPMELYPDMLHFEPDTAVMTPMMIEGIAKRTADMTVDDAKRLLGGRLKTIFSGGAHLDQAMSRAFARIGIRALSGYGITEAGCAVACTRNRQAERPGSVGMPFDGVPIRIDNPDAAGNGEVLIHEDYAMLGYYKNPTATDDALRGGWLHTGDIGRFDAEGYLYITGRIKNLVILANGENVSPEELERPLSQSKYVAECIVHEDGRAIAATIYPGEKYLDETKYPRAALLKRLYAEVDAINAGNSMSRHIGKIYLTDQPLPKVGSGKVKRG